jgi:hypothetical protein
MTHVNSVARGVTASEVKSAAARQVDGLLLAVLERGFDNPRIAVRPIVPVSGNQPTVANAQAPPQSNFVGFLFSDGNPAARRAPITSARSSCRLDSAIV